MNSLPSVGSVTEVKVSAALAAQGISIQRRLDGYPYAKCGNHHNPSPEYTYMVFCGGRRIGQDSLLRKAKEFASEYLATPPSER